MSDSAIAELAQRPTAWLHSPGEHAGIVLSSRIRLARNVAGWQFPRKLTPAKHKALVERLAQAAAVAVPGGQLVRLDRCSVVERALLVERQLVSRELAASKRPAGLWLSADERTALMLDEEDHLRLQVFASGLALERLLSEAVRIDVALGRDLGWAVDEQLGHLTACHTNVGTGLRASVMLHLPALAETGELKTVLRALEKLHLAVRGRHGEGSEAQGHWYQLSNRRTLGIDEDTSVRIVSEAALRVVEAERTAREALLEPGARTKLDDKVHRAWAILRHARVLSSEELSEQLGWLRLGLALDVLPRVSERPDWATLDRIMLACQPAHLQVVHPAAEDHAWRDRLRAELVRTALGA